VLLVGGGDTAHGVLPRLVSHQPATRIHLNLGQILIFLLKSNTVNEEIKRFLILIWQRLHKKKLPHAIVFSDSMITLANDER
jgi:hypothetical protein